MNLLPAAFALNRRIRYVTILGFMFCILWIPRWATQAQHYQAAQHGNAAPSLQLPPGFAMQTLVSGLTLPVDMEFLPNGDILVAEKGTGKHEEGRSSIRLVRGGQLLEMPVITLRTNVETDSGILGIILDPNFDQNNHFYVWHSTGDGATLWGGNSVMRLTRYTLNLSSGRADPASELIILNSIKWDDLHGGGSLAFDGAGDLYIGTGDAHDFDTAKDLKEWTGKVLRIHPTETGYTIPADNPYVGRDARPEIYASGLRNPFRMTQRQRDGKIVIGDVGQDTYEEINEVIREANYGWPAREGPCERGVRQPCSPNPPQYTAPLLAYEHDHGAAVAAMAFYEGTTFPEIYHDQLFFADYNHKYIAYANIDAEADARTINRFVSNTAGYVDMEYRAEGLYLVAIEAGVIHYIYHTGSTNQAPVAHFTASSLFGAAPLPVNFSATETMDVDDVVLQYHWDFGDGSPEITTTSLTIDHLYEADGTYTATLRVTDIRGGESTVSHVITVYSGEVPQIALENLTQAGRGRFHDADRYELRALRVGGTAGLDAARPFAWRVDLHHNDHAHPIMVDVAGETVPLLVDVADHAIEPTIFFRASLTMLTDQGQPVTVRQNLWPDLVEIGVDARPSSATVRAGDIRMQTPGSLTAIPNSRVPLSAPAELVFDGGVGRFAYWHTYQTEWPITAAAPDSLIFSSTITITTPVLGVSYDAYYEYDRPAQRAWLPSIAR